MKILLDNGHGLETKGKRSPISNLFEWEFNRDIVSKVKEILSRDNIDCEILVPEIEDISLSERCKRANTYNDALLISIHANAGNGTGFEVYRFPGSLDGFTIALNINLTLEKELVEFRSRGVKEKKFYILRHTKHPAVLIECLFMDQKKDCDFMCSTEGRNRIAKAIAQGIINCVK